MELSDAVLMVTSRCNSKCAMCEAWKDKSGVDLPFESYKRLPATLKSINISGGEPFLREDLPEVVRSISDKCRKARLVISTNGIEVERIKKQLPLMMNTVSRLGIRVSVDGIGEVHDRVRGIPGNFAQCIEVINYCKEIGMKDIGIGTTVCKLNEANISQVKDLADSLNVQFTCTVVHSSPILFGENEAIAPEPKTAIDQLRQIERSYLKSSTPKNWFRAYFTEGIIEYIEGRAKRIQCKAGQVFVFIKANGDIFPCNLLDHKMGNMLENGLEDIIGNSEKVRSVVRACSRKCWMICTRVPMIKRNPFHALVWMGQRKVRMLLRNRL